MMSDISTKPVGRPPKLTPPVVTKLEAGFALGYNDSAACIYAGISRQTYYRWLSEDEGFSYKINAAKARPNMRAGAVIMDAIDGGNWQAARWWLERKLPEEFGAFHHPTPVSNKIARPISQLTPQQMESLIHAAEAADSISED
jgi:hypothetical protein